ncbi:MAG: methionine adenosyltransferase [Culicoidibacterales bacterium]
MVQTTEKDLILFTSESVSEGHPDKVCDQISDAILDACLAQDPFARVACETLATTGRVVVAGEITTTAVIDVESIVRQKLRDIGYTDSTIGIGADDCEILNYLHAQSPDIAQGVDNAEDNRETLGAGDQGIMFGYACDETDVYMPLPIIVAHELVRVATELRKSGEFVDARPDMKSQVTIDYTNSKQPKVNTVLMSIQHAENHDEVAFRKYVKTQIMDVVLERFGLDTSDYRVLINPTGRFVIGGPHGDTGLTGRKIIVDTYGGYARHGGGAFSGKDATKVDRSAAYAARYVAKNIVAAGLATKCELQLSYAIGVAEPTSILIETFGTEMVPHEVIVKAVRENFDLRPSGIIEMLDLRRPIFAPTAAYGHFGRLDVELPWEKTDKVLALQKAVQA